MPSAEIEPVGMSDEQKRRWERYRALLRRYRKMATLPAHLVRTCDLSSYDQNRQFGRVLPEQRGGAQC